MIIPVPPPPAAATAPIRKRIERIAGRVAMHTLLGPLRSLPLPAARVCGRCLGAILYRCLGRYRRVALKNLGLVYSELPKRDRIRMARAVFGHFGEMAAEFIKLPQIGLEQVDRMAIVDGEEHLASALQAKRGGFIITGHFGNWEFLARWLTTHGYRLNVVTRDARDPAATKLMTDIRRGSGAQVLYRGNSARAVLQSLKRNELVGILPDQNAADVFVPFLGIPTGTVDGPAILHLKTGAPLIFSWCRRMPDGRFRITFEPAEIVAPTGDRNADIVKVMTLVNARLEAQVRLWPTQWLWLHDRWKASPGVFPGGDWQAHELTTAANKVKREVEEFHDSAQR